MVLGQRELFLDSEILSESVFKTAETFIEVRAEKWQVYFLLNGKNFQNACASMGNTDLYPVLLSSTCRSHDFVTNLVLFSDGYINNVSSAIKLLFGAEKFRVFSFACG